MLIVEFQAVCCSRMSIGLDIRRPGFLTLHFDQLTRGFETSVTFYLKWSYNTCLTYFLVLLGVFHIILYVSHIFNPLPRPILFLQVPKYSWDMPFLLIITPFQVSCSAALLCGQLDTKSTVVAAATTVFRLFSEQRPLWPLYNVIDHWEEPLVFLLLVISGDPVLSR